MSTNAQVLNNLFSQKLETTEGREKTAMAARNFIRDKLRELSFYDKVVQPENVTPADCQVSTKHDTLVMIIEVEPQSKGAVLTLRGEPTARIITGDRFEAPFFTISSEKYEKTEQELMVYRMPITKIIEDNSVKDLQEVKDREWLRHIESAVQFMQLEVTAGGNTPTAFNSSGYLAAPTLAASVVKGQGALQSATDDFTLFPIMKSDFVDLMNVIDSRRLVTDRFLLTEPDWNNILAWTTSDVGSPKASEIVVSGYKYNEILGKKYVRTIKTDILRRGNVYAFTEPEFFAKNYVLNNVKFFIDKKSNWISFQSWMDVGGGIGNVAAVAKLELYSGSVTPGATDTGYAGALPVAEAALGGKNNRVSTSGVYPNVSSY